MLFKRGQFNPTKWRKLAPVALQKGIAEQIGANETPVINFFTSLSFWLWLLLNKGSYSRLAGNPKIEF